MPNERWVDVPARLEALLARIRQLRKNLYPEGWTYDPLYHVEKELELLLQEMREKRPA
jgi:hypothetical protein